MGIVIAMMLSVGAVVVGIGLLSDSSASSVARVADAWKTMETRAGDIARTGLEALDTKYVEPFVDITVRNAGQKPLSDFSAWDVVARYFDAGGGYNVTSLSYTTAASPTNDQWTVKEINVYAHPAFDNVTTSAPSGPRSTVSFSHTVATQSNRILVVGTGAEDAAEADCNVTGVTFNGSPLTEIDDVVTATGAMRQCASLWYLVAPDSGAQTVAVSFAGTVNEASAGAISVYNAKQQGPEASNSQAQTGISSITTNITTLTNGAWVIDTVSSNDSGGGLTPASGQAERYAVTNGSSAIGGSTRETPRDATVGVSWDHSADRLAHVVAVFAPSPVTSEIFQPNVLDPGEEIVLRLRLDPQIDIDATSQFTVSMENGVTVAAFAPDPAAWYVLNHTPSNVKSGGALATDGTDIYALRGDRSTDFWRFTVATGSWTSLADTSGDVKEGGALAYATDGGSGYLYAFSGGKKLDFWRFNIGSGVWENGVDASSQAGWGASLAWDGSDTIYAFTGDGGPSTNPKAFWKYSIADDSWTGLADAPADVKAGGALVYFSGNIYALGGNDTKNFWKYDVGLQAWSWLADTPNNVKAGGALSTNGVSLYALRGNGTNEFWQYEPTADAWTSLEATLAPVKEGGALAYLNGYLYALQGNQSTQFWKYGEIA